MADQFKDVEVAGSRYRVERMSARVGSWIAMQIMTSILPMGMDGEVTQGRSLPGGRSEMSEASFHNLQDHCLSVVRRYESTAPDSPPSPVFVDGKFTFRDLDQDVVSVMELTLESLVFNVSPFFSDGALTRVLGTFRGLSSVLTPSNAPK